MKAKEKANDQPVDVNEVLLVGAIEDRPNLKYMANGTAVARFILVTVVDAWEDGKQRTSRIRHRIVVFGKDAERCNDEMNAENRVKVRGRIARKFKGEVQGKRMYDTEIVGNSWRGS